MPAKKRVHGEGKWIEQDILSVRQQDYQVIAELSGKFLVQLLCRAAGIKRSSFYSWRKARLSPSGKATRLARSIALFSQYHLKYPSHGYRWLNAKIKLDTGIVNSAPYAHKCCQLAGIKSRSHHYRYKKPGEPERKYPNLLMAGMSITGPLQCVVSDMTAFRVKGVYYELTLYMDLWDNEIIAHVLSSKCGDCNTYLSGLHDVLELKKKCPDCQMVLHTDQGSVYASKAFNELLPLSGVTRSMSRAGTPTGNAAMESINGWIKTELFTDFHVTGKGDVSHEIDDYIKFFNTERPAYSLGYLTPVQYREQHISDANTKKSEKLAVSKN